MSLDVWHTELNETAQLPEGAAERIVNERCTDTIYFRLGGEVPCHGHMLQAVYGFNFGARCLVVDPGNPQAALDTLKLGEADVADLVQKLPQGFQPCCELTRVATAKSKHVGCCFKHITLDLQCVAPCGGPKFAMKVFWCGKESNGKCKTTPWHARPNEFRIKDGRHACQHACFLRASGRHLTYRPKKTQGCDHCSDAFGVDSIECKFRVPTSCTSPACQFEGVNTDIQPERLLQTFGHCIPKLQDFDQRKRCKAILEELSTELDRTFPGAPVPALPMPAPAHATMPPVRLPLNDTPAFLAASDTQFPSTPTPPFMSFQVSADVNYEEDFMHQIHSF